MNELYALASHDVTAFVLVYIRISAIFATVPFFSAQLLPRRITAVVAFFLALVLLPVVHVPPASFEAMNMLDFVMLIMQSVMIGMTIGLTINIIFAAVQIAGQYAGFQMGFAIANVVDPMTGVNAPVTANLLYITAFLIFLAFGGDHMMIKAMVQSFSLVPMDGAWGQPSFFMAMVSYASNMFLIGLKVAAPVIGVLLLMNIAFGLMARAAPQMNVFIVSFPLTIGVGLTFIVIVIKLLPFFMEGSVKQAWDFIIQTLKMYG